jgi:succinate-semialdehyde dehydrogenase / glutarate-semialdehyde dehydrogenase
MRHLDCYDLILNYAWINNQKTGSSDGRTYGPVVRFSVSTARPRLLKPPMAGLRSGRAFYSRDLARVMHISSQLQAGLVSVNEGAISTELGPSGGVNESADGGEGSKYGIDEHLQMKYLCLGGSGAVKYCVKENI